MARFLPPEGYLYDKNTGLYYSQVIAKNQEGITCQIVTWFDSETGEYSRNIYPVNCDTDKRKQEQVKTKTASAPRQNERKKKQLNRISHQNTSRRARKPLDRGFISHNTGKIINPSIQYVLLGIIGLLLLVIIVGNATLAVKKHLNSEKKLMESVAKLSDGDDEENASDSTEAEETIEESAYSIDGDYSTVWRGNTERGYLSVYNMTVSEDDEYVYTIKAEGQNWYETDNIPYGELVRFRKSDIYDVETIIPREDPITALTVMGDYIYYGKLTSDGRCNYTRRNKNTGEELFLLSEDYSLLTSDNGVLYFLFAEDDRNQLGMFDVATGEMNYKDINYDFPAAIEKSGNYSLFAPFGFYDGLLCVGGHIGDNIVFRSMVDLDADEIKCAFCRDKFLGASLSQDEASPEASRYYRRYGMGAMFGPGERNPYRIMGQEINGKIQLFNYSGEISDTLAAFYAENDRPEADIYNRLELSLRDIFTGDRPEKGYFGFGFILEFDKYPQMALSLDNYPTGITSDFYIYNNYIVRVERASCKIVEIAEY